MSGNSERKFDPNDPYTIASMEWIEKHILHARTNHSGNLNTVMFPVAMWENMGRPMRLFGLRVIPFDDACKDPIVWVGTTPEELKL